MTTKSEFPNEQPESERKVDEEQMPETLESEESEEAALIPAEPEEAEKEKKVKGPKRLREVRKKILDQIGAVIEYVQAMRDLERSHRKWMEKRLQKLEEELIEVQVEVKSLKAKAKK
jgi:hypothetical protein